MTKKTLLSIFVLLTLLVLSSCVFAANNVGDELRDSWNRTEQTLNNVGGAVSNTVSDITNNNNNNNNNTNSNNSGNDAGTDNNRSTNGTAGVTTMMNTDGNDGYTATRTATTNTGNGISNLAMTWIILAITAAIIVALIWYYGTQNNETRIKDND